MQKEQAIKILISAVEIAQQKGAFSLEDAGAILASVRVLKTPKAGTPKPEPKKIKKTK